jgi:hypothetical protein
VPGNIVDATRRALQRDVLHIPEQLVLRTDGPRPTPDIPPTPRRRLHSVLLTG